jgi:hypothetical protein
MQGAASATSSGVYLIVHTSFVQRTGTYHPEQVRRFAGCKAAPASQRRSVAALPLSECPSAALDVYVFARDWHIRAVLLCCTFVALHCCLSRDGDQIMHTDAGH